MQELTQEYLKSILNYDHHTGLFVWIIAKGSRAKTNSVAGAVSKKGYIVIRVNGKLYQSHRLAWLYVFGELPKNQIDHINHIKSDNRIINLRHVTSGDNQKNASMRKDNTSGFTGISWDAKGEKWRARINLNGNETPLGYFNDKFEAICARLSANNKYGFHKNHGANNAPEFADEGGE